jgi:DNA mismatch repair ATPase MutS
LNSLANPVLLLPKEESSIISRFLPLERRYTYRLDPRDEAGARILEDIRNWVLSKIATTMLNAFDKLMNFFKDLAKQLSFYVGAINLSDFLDKLGIPKTYPDIDSRKLVFENLYPLSLAVSSMKKPVPNNLDMDVESSFAVIVTGVNKGGKTTFLKGVGQALLLARAGLFVPAERFVMPSTGAVFTHFLREEERTFSYGKFEEEVKRFKAIVDDLRRGDYVLMDESFASTNHVEASVVAENVVSALLDSGVNVFYVTFLQDFLYKFVPKNSKRVVLLVPERLSDGTRTYRLVKGSIQPGYALELWRKIAEAHS